MSGDDMDAGEASESSSHNGEGAQISKATKRKQRQIELRAAKAKRGGGSSEPSVGPPSTGPGEITADAQLQDASGDADAVKSAVKMEYCPTCGFPPDFCEFGPNWDKCQPTALTRHRQYYKHYCAANNVPLADETTEASAAAGVADDRPSEVLSETRPSEARPSDKPTKPEKGGKKGEPKSPQITIQRVTRARHKVATIVTGLDSFGTPLDAAAKIFKKRFACGSAAVKGLPGQTDHVEIQGDFEDVIWEVILQNYPQIPERALLRLKPK